MYARMIRLQQQIRLVVFDLDGTITQVESTWQYIHERLGTWQKGKLSAEKYWSGKISYAKWAELDSSMWRGTGIQEIRSIVDEIPYANGARETMMRLRERRKLLGIVSAGVSLLSDRVKEDLGMDFAIANDLEVFEGRMTGRVAVNVSLNEKAFVIKRVAEQLGVSLRECVVVGDNSFDLPRNVGLRIAFNSRDNTSIACDVLVGGTDMRAILEHIP
jgi:phosphoserine phosphatase